MCCNHTIETETKLYAMCHHQLPEPFQRIFLGRQCSHAVMFSNVTFSYSSIYASCWYMWFMFPAFLSSFVFFLAVDCDNKW